MIPKYNLGDFVYFINRDRLRRGNVVKIEITETDIKYCIFDSKYGHISLNENDIDKDAKMIVNNVLLDYLYKEKELLFDDVYFKLTNADLNDKTNNTKQNIISICIEHIYQSLIRIKNIRINLCK